MADELAADGNVDGSLLLVSCDDPHLHRQMPIYDVGLNHKPYILTFKTLNSDQHQG